MDKCWNVGFYYFAELLTKVLLKRLDSFDASLYAYGRDPSMHIHWFACQSVIVGHGVLYAYIIISFIMLRCTL